MTPLYLLIIVFPEFNPLKAAGKALFRKMSQNAKIYLPYTEYKRNRL
jgi:hypothetical protein